MPTAQNARCLLGAGRAAGGLPVGRSGTACMRLPLRATALGVAQRSRPRPSALPFAPLVPAQELGELLSIGTLPTFVLIKGGAEVHRVEGAPQQRPARKLAQAIRQHLLGEAEDTTGAQ